MAAGAPGTTGAAAGKPSLAPAGSAREAMHCAPKPAADEARPVAPRSQPAINGPERDEHRQQAKDAVTTREAASGAADGNPPRVATGADGAGNRRDFAAALDKARTPALPPGQSAAQQAANATAVSADAVAAAEAQSLAQQGGDAGEMRAAPTGKVADGKPKAEGDATDDPLATATATASAAVAALLGWLQPVAPAAGQAHAGGGAGQGAAEGEGGECGDAIIAGVRATSGATGAAAADGAQAVAQARHAPTISMAGLAAGDGTQGVGGQPPQPASPKGADAGSEAAAADAAPASLQPRDARPAAGATGSNAQAAGFEAGQSLRASAAALATPVERNVPAPMGDRHWARALSTQVMLLANHKVESATLRLSPEHTGPIEVRIQLQDAGVNLAFNASQADTRAALEQALPQLRAAFAGAGLALGQATVGQQMRQGSQFSQGAHNAAGSAADHPEATAAITRQVGLVDEYA